MISTSISAKYGRYRYIAENIGGPLPLITLMGCQQKMKLLSIIFLINLDVGLELGNNFQPLATLELLERFANCITTDFGKF